LREWGRLGGGGVRWEIRNEEEKKFERIDATSEGIEEKGSS